MVTFAILASIAATRLFFGSHALETQGGPCAKPPQGGAINFEFHLTLPVGAHEGDEVHGSGVLRLWGDVFV